MSKMGSHGPFGHMQHTLWQKEGSRIKPLKVINRLDPGACRWSSTHHWKAIEESYKFDLDLIPIRGLSKELEP